jgi:hypothetical protein
MPTPKKSTKTLVASGAFSQNPSRAEGRGDDMLPTGELRACPTAFTDSQKQCWAELVAMMPPGVLKNADNFAVENLAVLQAMTRDGSATMSTYAQVTALLDRFGLNPKARPNVQIPKTKAGNQFASI